MNNLSIREKEDKFNLQIISEYLKYGSVDEVFKIHDYHLPISYPGFQRLLDKWGIVKAAGPNTRLSEALAFLTRLSYEKVPLETLYRKMPPSFKTSMGTLHRILSCVRDETIRRVGTALVLYPKGNPKKVLVGSDVSPISRDHLGKFHGVISFPAGYSTRTENAYSSILRVLQQEVFTNEVIKGNHEFEKLIPGNPKPFMYVDVADVRVAVYKIALPKKYLSTKSFSSFKLVRHHFIDVKKLVSAGNLFRTGMREIGLVLLNARNRAWKKDNSALSFSKSLLNQELLTLSGIFKGASENLG